MTEPRGAGIRVRRLSEDEWVTLRSIRLNALRDAPHAFASTYQQEAAWDASAWRRAVRRAAWFLAWDGDEPVGLVAAFAEPGAPATERHVVSLWVAPHRRGAGVAARLFDAVARWAREDGATSLMLWVTEGNDAADRIYQRLGFLPTGRRQPLPSDPTRREQQMWVTLYPDR
jgi:GNAT superfamily N-acetyltransferase